MVAAVRPLSLTALAAALALLLGCPQSTPSPAGTTSGEAAPPDLPGPWMSAAAPASADAPVREIVGAAHILVSYKGALGAPKTILRSKEAAKKRAEEALAKLKSKKATFEQLVDDYTDDITSKPAHGGLGNFERNVFPQSFSDATFNLPLGGTSDVVETPRGFHIIRRIK
jgi:hypothetical protein